MEHNFYNHESNSIINHKKNPNNLHEPLQIKKSKRTSIDSIPLKFYYIDQAKMSPGRKKNFRKTNTMTETQVNFLFRDNLGDLKRISISKMTESASISSKNEVSGNSKGSKKKKLKSQRGKNGIRRLSTYNDSFKNKICSKMSSNHFPIIPTGPNFNINIINHQQCELFKHQPDLTVLQENNQMNLSSEQ
jgi:hypothetical protein